MKKRALKFIGLSILIYIFLCLITPFNGFLRKRSIKNQIHYLSKTLKRGYDNELQLRFPEGKLFSNSILALSTIEFCESNKKAPKKYAKIVDQCIKRIQSDQALRTFNPEMNPPYGMFYNGWTNYVYHSYQKSQLFQHSQIKEKVKEQSSIIEERLTNTLRDSLRLLDSYNGSYWPADNCIGILSIENDTLRKQWLETLFNTTQHPAGLIHHAGSNSINIRGSSSAMISFCLSELGYEAITPYNDKFKEIFIDTYLGIQLVKEHEDGSNRMDVDSGPVLWGYGASATIMNIKTQASVNSINAKFTYGAMNLISFPINLFNRKFHLLKKEPMFDLFMLWGSTEIG